MLGAEWRLRLFPTEQHGGVGAVGAGRRLGGDDQWRWPLRRGGLWRRDKCAGSKASDGVEVLALFPHADRQRWIAWTPQGFFHASPGAEELIGYHLNRGRDREGEFIAARQLRETFFQPGLIAVRSTRKGTHGWPRRWKQGGDIRTLLEAGATPELALVSPARAESDGTYSFEVQLKNPGQGGGSLRRVVRRGWAGCQWPQGGAGSDARRNQADSRRSSKTGEHTVSAEWVDSRGISSTRSRSRCASMCSGRRLGPAVRCMSWPWRSATISTAR